MYIYTNIPPIKPQEKVDDPYMKSHPLILGIINFHVYQLSNIYFNSLCAASTISLKLVKGSTSSLSFGFTK